MSRSWWKAGAVGIALSMLAACQSENATFEPAASTGEPVVATEPLPVKTDPVSSTPSIVQSKLPRPTVEALAPEREMTAFAEVFPHVRVDVTNSVVEFDGTVPIDAHDELAPDVFLEAIVCTFNTKEHESLVVTRARPSHVHAALLLIGLEPGEPGGYDWKDERLVPIEPTGPPLEVELVWRDAAGSVHSDTPEDWVQGIRSGSPLAHAGWKFAGSMIITRDGEDVYDADGAGSLVGLAAFGSETIAYGKTFSPESSHDVPEWIASPQTPPIDTAVIVRLRPRGD